MLDSISTHLLLVFYFLYTKSELFELLSRLSRYVISWFLVHSLNSLWSPWTCCGSLQRTAITWIKL